MPHEEKDQSGGDQPEPCPAAPGEQEAGPHDPDAEDGLDPPEAFPAPDEHGDGDGDHEDQVFAEHVRVFEGRDGPSRDAAEHFAVEPRVRGIAAVGEVLIDPVKTDQGRGEHGGGRAPDQPFTGSNQGHGQEIPGHEADHQKRGLEGGGREGDRAPEEGENGEGSRHDVHGLEPEDPLPPEEFEEEAERGVDHKGCKNHRRQPRHGEEEGQHPDLGFDQNEAGGGDPGQSEKEQGGRDPVGQRAEEDAKQKRHVEVPAVAFRSQIFGAESADFQRGPSDGGVCQRFGQGFLR